MEKLIKKIKITARLELLTGLYIGDSKENVQIGGLDSSVIRRKDNNQPYIFGSSLKGKLRSLLERSMGISDFKNHNNSISILFGSTDNSSRILVRDSYLTEKSEETLSDSDFIDIPYAEVKVENTIDRVTGMAKSGLRTFERVPAGAEFNIEMIINIHENDDENELIATLRNAKKMLELDYLGGSGSRGYGQIKFHDWNEDPFVLEDILNGEL